MAKIYAGIKGIEAPKFNWNDLNAYGKQCEEYVEKLRAAVRIEDSDPLIGEVISFQVADGYAKYLVSSLKPVSLIHLPFDDVYEFQYAHLLTIKEICDLVKQQEAMRKFFAKKG